jgi:hypothetical protein
MRIEVGLRGRLALDDKYLWNGCAERGRSTESD